MVVNSVAAVQNQVNRTNRLFASLRAANINALVQSSTSGATNTATVFDTADIVELTPAAQTLLDQYNALGSNTGLSDQGIILTSEQQLQFDAIIEKYRDEQFDEETYNRLLADLNAAGITADQLALRYYAIQFSDPTARLLEGLTDQDNVLQTPADILTALPLSPLPETPVVNQSNYDAFQQLLSQFQGVRLVA